MSMKALTNRAPLFVFGIVLVVKFSLMMMIMNSRHWEAIQSLESQLEMANGKTNTQISKMDNQIRNLTRRIQVMETKTAAATSQHSYTDMDNDIQKTNPLSKSQDKQDLFIDEHIFGGKKHGYYIEAGALDGVTLSNSYLFQKGREWKGLLVEPNPSFIPKIQMSRAGPSDIHQPAVFHGCLTADGPRNMTFRPPREIAGGLGTLGDTTATKGLNHHFGAPVTVICDTLSHVLRDLPPAAQPLATTSHKHIIDFFSLDVEGHEMDVLRSIDFSQIRIDALLVESHPPTQTGSVKIPGMIDEFQKFLEPRGYRVVASLPHGCRWGKNCVDLLFCRNDFTGPDGSNPLPVHDPFSIMEGPLRRHWKIINGKD